MKRRFRLHLLFLWLTIGFTVLSTLMLTEKILHVRILGFPAVADIVFFMITISGVVGCGIYLILFFWYDQKIFDTFYEKSGMDGKRYHLPSKEAEMLMETLEHFQEILDEQSQNHHSEILVKKAELAALQSQINPHFLYNTLEAIRGIALKRQIPEVADMTEALSLLFRYSISTRDEFVTLGEDMENLDHYLLIQQYRFSNRFEIIKEFEDEKQVLNMEIPKLIIQPIVENAIYHGLETTVEKGIIKITAYLTEDNFVICITDNGVGMDMETLEYLNQRLNHSDINQRRGEGGIALINVNERIKLYYGDKYGLDVYSTKGLGTTVKVTFPY